jgi:hypothetical protein
VINWELGYRTRRSFMILYRSHSIVRKVKYKAIQWAVHVACMIKARNSYNYEYLEDQNRWRDLCYLKLSNTHNNLVLLCYFSIP